MTKISSITISLIVVGIVIFPTIGYQYDIYNTLRFSSIFTVSSICIPAGLIFVFCRHRAIVTFTYIDLFVFVFLLFYTVDSFSTCTLWNAGCLSLAFLFMILRYSSRLKYQYFYYAALIATDILAIWGYLQLWGMTDSRNVHFSITGPYHNPGILGGIMCVLLSIIISGALLKLSRLYKRKDLFWGVCFTFLFTLPILLLTASRASWIALLCSFFYTLYVYYFKHFPWRKKILCLFSIILSVAIATCMLYYLKPVSANGRLLIWKVSWQMIKAKPFTGFGKNGFQANYLYYQAKHLEANALEDEKYIAGNTHIPFNEFIRITVEHGITGLIIYVVFILLILFIPIKPDIISYTVRSAILVISVWGIFSYPNRIFFMMTLYVILISILFNRYDKLKVIKDSMVIKIPTFLIRCFVFVFLALSTIFIREYYDLYHKFQKRLETADELVENPTVLKAFQEQMSNDIGFLFFSASVFEKCNNEKMFMKVVQTLEKKYPTPSLFIQKGDFLLKMDNYTEAEKAYWIAAQMVPARQKARYKLALLYNQIGKKHEAIILTRGILNEKVKIYNFDTFEMHQYLKKIFREFL